MTAGHDVAAAVDEARLGRLVDRLAGFGALPAGGMDRQALSEDDLAARRFVVDLARSFGAEVIRDPAANLYLRWSGLEDGPPVATGSHIDTQPSGGSLDGAYGVCAALEVLAALASTGHHARRPIEAIVWTNEEGCRFSPGTMGSSAFADPDLLEHFRASTDLDGITLADALGRVDAAFDDVPVRSLGVPMHAFIEAHIEQGPLLEAGGIQVGLVRGIQGSRWFEYRVAGRASHAGTTPRSLKQDALRAASEIATAIYRILDAGDDRLRLTVGRVTVRPNSPNVVPAEVTFTVDLRHPDDAVLAAVEVALRELARPTAGCMVEIARTMLMAPVAFDADVMAAIARAAGEWSPTFVEIDSGAFHDSLRLVGHCPTGMVFVPSIGGISHAPDERTNLADMAAGARVLAQAVVDLANR